MAIMQGSLNSYSTKSPLIIYVLAFAEYQNSSDICATHYVHIRVKEGGGKIMNMMTFFCST